MTSQIVPIAVRRIFSTAPRLRCQAPNDRLLPNDWVTKALLVQRWGGRGIRVCERWRQSFVNFFEDMGKKPNSKYSLERIDNNGNYTPENCRWATPVQQMNNTRRNRILAINGIERNVTQWGKSVGLKPGTISSRLRIGWSEHDAVLTPHRGRRNKNYFHLPGRYS